MSADGRALRPLGGGVIAAVIPTCQGAIRTYNPLKIRGNSPFGVATLGVMDESRTLSKFGPNRDIDPKRACDKCGRPGLHWKNTSGLCAKCFRRLSTIAKSAGTTEAVGVIRYFAKQMVDKDGLAASAQALKLDPQTTIAATKGEICIMPLSALANSRSAPIDGDSQVDDPVQAAYRLELPREPARQLTAADLGLPADHPLAGVQLDPDLLADVIRRYRELQPLHPTLAKLIAPWRRAMRIEIAKEDPGQRVRRLNRAKARELVVRYVPPPDAPLDPTKRINAYGCDPTASHLPQHKLPMRVAVGLWAKGFGAGGIVKIADRAKRPVSKSVVHRLLERSKFRFMGRAMVKLGDLASDLCGSDGHRRR